MSSRTRWLLPAGIEEVLPKEAIVLESYRRKSLDLFSSWGYRLVMPPFIEFLDSLLIGECEDLNLQTFKLTDQLSGRMMGVRADMTPQVARIDAHMIKSDAPTRLCYCGTVLHTLPETAGGTRSPLQIGAELYGHQGLESDVEIISLMNTALQSNGIQNILLDIGHTGIYETLIAKANLADNIQNELNNMLQRKASADIQDLLTSVECSSEIKQAIIKLVDMHGSYAILQQAREQLAVGGKKLIECIDYIDNLSQTLNNKLRNTAIHYDLAESHGYHYQKGIVFTAFCADTKNELARGGRYDNIGESFGRARPAIGFSADLRQIILVSSNSESQTISAIYAPMTDDPSLTSAITELRANCDTVIHGLSNNSEEATSLGCNRILYKNNNKWSVQDI